MNLNSKVSSSVRMYKYMMSKIKNQRPKREVVTVNGKTYTNTLPFNGKFCLVSVYHPFKTVHLKRFMQNV